MGIVSMDCPHFTAPDQCAVVRELARGDRVTTLTPGACQFCTEKAEPRQTVNEVTVSLAVAQLQNDPTARARVLSDYGHLLRREFPPWAKQAWNLAAAVADWLAAGGHGIDRPQYEARLARCDACPNRDAHRCRVCGCYVRGKAAMPTESCPLGLWPPLSSPGPA
jgi:hypothetical protein